MDYELALPRLTRIRLKFGIAMGPDVARPDRSDGVTFSCALTADGRPQELMRRHQAEACWLDFDFDLTPYAGKTVNLRLQVEPGPKNNSSFDYSFFGDARIAVGKRAPQRSEILRRLTSTRAYQATARADLANLVVFPYPRDKSFQVSLDLQALAPTAAPQHVQVQALAAGTQQPLGPGDFALENARLVLTTGTPGAGRYAVTWKTKTAAK